MLLLRLPVPASPVVPRTAALLPQIENQIGGAIRDSTPLMRVMGWSLIKPIKQTRIKKTKCRTNSTSQHSTSNSTTISHLALLFLSPCHLVTLSPCHQLQECINVFRSTTGIQLPSQYSTVQSLGTEFTLLNIVEKATATVRTEAIYERRQNKRRARVTWPDMA